jgi:hypothetical protein
LLAFFNARGAHQHALVCRRSGPRESSGDRQQGERHGNPSTALTSPEDSH